MLGDETVLPQTLVTTPHDKSPNGIEENKAKLDPEFETWPRLMHLISKLQMMVASRPVHDSCMLGDETVLPQTLPRLITKLLKKTLPNLIRHIKPGHASCTLGDEPHIETADD